jgi:hypothetical protein
MSGRPGTQFHAQGLSRGGRSKVESAFLPAFVASRLEDLGSSAASHLNS